MRSAGHRLRAAAPRIALALALCAGCDAAVVPAPPAACAQVGQQCQLPDGPLGVCQQIACAAAVTPPCLRCTSQH